MSPFIYFFDIDGTLVGNVTPQIIEWDLLIRFNKSNLNIFKNNLISHLKNGLLRPHLSTYLDSLRVKGDCEFYIYTASNAEWANILVDSIEKVIGIKFNRPIFNRTHCLKGDNMYMKSISKISSKILAKLKQKYPEKIKTIKNIVDNSIFIDNNKVLIKKEEHLLHLCPTYHYIDIYDVTRSLSEITLCKDFLEISKILNLYSFFPKYDNDQIMTYNLFKVIYYSHLSNFIKNNFKGMAKKKEDTFWLQMH